MEVATRRVHFAGCTTNPDEPWMKQIARNLTDPFDGFLLGKCYLIIDPGDEVGRSQGDVECREHVGGLLRYYYRAAA